VAETATRRFVTNPNAMAIGLPDALADACSQHLAPLPMTRVAHVVAACERMVVIRPQVIVVMARAEKLEMLRERAQDIGAELAELAPEMDELMVKAAVVNAKYRADKRW
jgi:hypothetical protein